MTALPDGIIKKLRANLVHGDEYDVIIGRRILGLPQHVVKSVPNANKFLIITDDTVRALYCDSLVNELNALGNSCYVYSFVPGEASKCHRTILDIYKTLNAHAFSRSDCIVALGGGVAGDIAGFAAATYLRGVGLVHIPTTLTSQADSAIGGKCGIDMFGKKNNIGAFYMPKLVICDSRFLGTLSRREFLCGMAEIIKMGFLAGEPLLSMLNNSSDIADIVAQSCAAKLKFIGSDICDNNMRQVLNFGHTTGHALEAASEYRISHGEAVSRGMVVAARLGVIMGITPLSVAESIRDTLRLAGLPIGIPSALKPIYKKYISADKKRSGGTMRVILLRSPGKPAVCKLPIKLLLEILP